MTKEEQKWEAELKAAGWRPLAAHPNSPTWRAPNGLIYAGPGYAWTVMQKHPNGEPTSNVIPSPEVESKAVPTLEFSQIAAKEAERQSRPRNTFSSVFPQIPLMANPDASEA